MDSGGQRKVDQFGALGASAGEVQHADRHVADIFQKRLIIGQGGVAAGLFVKTNDLGNVKDTVVPGQHLVASRCPFPGQVGAPGTVRLGLQKAVPRLQQIIDRCIAQRGHRGDGGPLADVGFQ